MKEKQQRVTEIHESLYSKSDNPGAIYELDGKKFVDLFPYKIRGRDRFYFRDHPKNIPPDSFEYRKYWGEFAKHCIEGKWIKDEAGTWVYMMPKLFYYINYVTIPDSKRRIIFPDLCDLEWIYFTYFLCIDGFSGFEDDDKYTCNYLIYRYNRSKDTNLSKIEREEYELDVIDMESIPDNCISKETGEYKEYVNPWEYLTRTYLIDDPRGPLGQPLYNNSRSNGIILGSRVCRKSFTTYLGDFNHEWTFGGVTRVENMKYCKNPLLFAMGAGTASQINRTLKNVRAFYDSQPGSYVNKINPDEPKYMGPFYKNYQGSLSTGKEFQHIVKDSQGKKVEIFGSTCQVSALTPDRTKLGAGDRFRRIYIEEVGFIPYIEDVINANEDSIKIGDEIVGSWIATGTSGDLEAIRGPKKIFENVKAYRVFGIPNYWKNMSKEIGFFIPTTYQDRKYEDSDGFVNIKLAAHNIMKQRAKKSKSSDSVKYLSHIMFNPVEPDEMLIPNTSSVLPKAEAMVRLSEIEEDNLDRLVKNVGTLEFDIKEPYGVRFDKDMEGKLNPIDYYVYDSKKIDSRGAFKMYESPPPIIPKNMYWVVYDPAAQDGEGTSNHALIVYKHRLSSDGRNWTDTIVAEWIGRYSTLEENFEMVIKVAKFFNAKIFPEMNTPGFTSWCKANNYLGMLQRDSYLLERELNPNYKSRSLGVGVRMDGRKKKYALSKLSDWFMEVRKYDDESGIPIIRNIDLIYSRRILDEVINFGDDNYDFISCLLLLMILMGQLDSYKPIDEMAEEDEYYNLTNVNYTLGRRRSTFETL